MPTERFRAIVAVHLFLLRGDAILLLRRCDTGYEDGNYSVIAGHLDGGEEVVTAAVREAHEEAGIRIAPEDVTVVGVMHRRSDTERIDFFVSATRWAGAIVNREPGKCDELAWFPLDALPINVIPYVRHAIANARAGRWFDSFGWDSATGGGAMKHEWSVAPLVAGIARTGDVRRDVVAFLTRHGRPDTAEHCAEVAAEARRIARMAGVDVGAAERAGWFHDISAVIPNEERVAAAGALGVPVLPEEAAFPMIIHQKLSAALAQRLFGEADPGVLGAVGCHTTLKRGATPLDTVVFVADKIAWDQPGIPPYRDALLAALEESVDAAALVYLRFLWERRATLAVIHPWFRDAYRQRAGE
jgi:predicted HD superfamily hydrolase involved in NAD metabolism